MISAYLGCFTQITRALGDQGNALHVAHIAKVIDAPVRSRPSPGALPHRNGANRHAATRRLKRLACNNLGRCPNVLAAYMASNT